MSLPIIPSSDPTLFFIRMKQKHLIYSLLLLLPLAGCARRSQHYERSSVSVDVITLHAAENRNMHIYSGTTEARTSIPLSFQLGGQIVRVCVRNGQYVNAGTVIAVADSANAASGLRLAEAGLRQAQDGYDRMMQVHQKGGVTEVKRMEVETQLERARQMVEIARQELNRCIILAPQSGTVSDLNLSAGQVLAPGQRVCNLIDTGGMMVRFSVAENDIASLREGDRSGWIEGHSSGARLGSLAARPHLFHSSFALELSGIRPSGYGVQGAA